MKTKRLLLLQACIMLFTFSALAETTIYQTENKTGGLNASVNTNQAGFNGTGFVEMVNGNGNYFEWNNINAASAGTAEIRFRYTNSDGSQRPRSCDIYVNGTNAGSYIFPWKDGGWAAWGYSTQVMTINLNAGNNTIRVQQNSVAASSPKVDEMEVVMGVPSVFNVTNVTVNPGNFGIFVGKNATLLANVLPTNADDKTVVWASDNTNIVGIDAGTGYLTAIAEGTANVTATSTDGGIVGTCTVTVYPTNIGTGTNPNLIQNPGFENADPLSSWGSWGNFTFTAVSGNVASGVNAATVANGLSGGFGQDVSIVSGDAGETFLFSVKVKTANAPASAQTGLKVFEGSTELNSPYYVTSTDAEFTTYSWIVATTTATTKVQAWVWKNASGDIYLDDYNFAKLDMTSTNLNRNTNKKLFSIYQNPSQKELNVKFNSNMGNANISISDLAGKSVYKTSVSDAGEIVISTERFAKGIYIVNIIGNGHSMNQKFIVQ